MEPGVKIFSTKSNTQLLLDLKKKRVTFEDMIPQSDNELKIQNQLQIEV